MTSLGTRLLGRTQASAQLAAALSEDRPCVVLGEPGIGKTTLVRAVAAHAGRQLHEGSGFATLASMPYLAVRRAIGRSLTGDPVAVAAIVEQAVGPDVLFVDDLQWVDPATREVLRLLEGRITVVGATRDPEPGRDDPWAAWVPVRLGPIDTDAAGAVARAVRPGLDPATLARLLERAAGNPLLIEELARDGAESPSIARAIADRLRHAGPAAVAAVQLLAVAGHPLPAAAFDTLGDDLDRLDLIVRRADLLAIRHSILSQVLIDGMTAEAVAAAHRRVATLVDEPAARARHLALGGLGPQAAEVAAGALARTTDIREQSDLVEILGRTAAGPERVGLRLRAARLHRDIGDDDAVIRILEARDLDDPWTGSTPEEIAWRDSLLVDAYRRCGRVADAVATQALLPGWHEYRATAIGLELAGSSALADAFAGRPSDGVATLDAALATGDSLPTAYRVRSLRATLRLLAGRAGATEGSRADLDAAILAGDLAASGVMALNLFNEVLLVEGARSAADFAIDQADRLDRAGLSGRAIQLRSNAVQCLLLAGDPLAAQALGDRVLERPGTVWDRACTSVFRAEAAIVMGRFAEAAHDLETAERARVTETVLGFVHRARAMLALWGGQPRVALEHAEAELATHALSEVNHVPSGLDRAWAEYELGRVPTAPPAVPGFPLTAGAEPEFAGIRALAAGDPAAARRLFEVAADGWTGFHAPRELICRWAAGEAARQAGDPAAVDRLRDALERAERMPFLPLAARARRSLRLGGFRVPGPRDRRIRPGDVLTPREREIVDHVAAGLSNIEIARRMGLGRPTVAQSLSRAMAKLDTDSRPALVAKATAAT